MAGPFDSAYLKLAWGKRHINKMKRAIRSFEVSRPWEFFTDLHPDKPQHVVQKVRLARPIPKEFSLIAGDAVDNIRASLDYAVYAAAVSSGRAEIRNACFPFADDAIGLEKKLNGRCADVPTEIWPLLRSFKPYKRGNDVLVALNQARNRNNHALLVSCEGITQVHSGSIQSTGGKISVPYLHVWDRKKNEMELFTRESSAKPEGNIELRILLVLTGIAEDEPAPRAILRFAGEAEKVIGAIYAECRRLGLCQ